MSALSKSNVNEQKPIGQGLRDLQDWLVRAVGALPTPQMAGRLNRAIMIMTGLVVLSLAGMSFILSFAAVKDLAAAKYGIEHAWLIPVIVEGAVIAGSLLVLYSELTGLGITSKSQGWALVAFGVGSSLVFNLAHSETGFPADLATFFTPEYLMRASPSISLLATFHILMLIVGHEARRTGQVAEVTNLEAEISKARKKTEATLVRLEAIISQAHQEAEIRQTEISAETDRLKAEATGEIETLKAEISSLKERKRQAAKPTIDSSAGRKARLSKQDRRRQEVRRLWESGMTVATEIAEALPKDLQATAKTVRADIKTLGLKAEGEL